MVRRKCRCWTHRSPSRDAHRLPGAIPSSPSSSSPRKPLTPGGWGVPQPPLACFHHPWWIIQETKSPGALNRIPGSPLDPGQEGSGRQRSMGRTGQRPGDLGVAWGGRTPGSLMAGWLEKRVRCALGDRTLGSLGRLGTWISGSLGCLGGGTSGSLGSLGTRTPGSLGSWVLRMPGSSLCS